MCVGRKRKSLIMKRLFRGRNDKGQIIVTVDALLFLGLILVNLLPDEVFHSLGIYHSTTPSFIRYKWLNYSFGVIDLLILIYGVFLSRKRRRNWLWVTSLILLVREVFFALFTEFSVLSEGRFDIYLTMLVGVAMIQWHLECAGDIADAWHKLIVVLIVNVCSVYINLLIGKPGILGGRFNAVNLDVGTTGVVAGISLVALLCDREFSNRFFWAILAAVSLVMSGSRINLLITLASCLLLFFVRIYRSSIKRYSFRIRISTILVLMGVILVVFFYGPVLLDRIYSSRIVTVFNNENIESALSGRPMSLFAGLNIMRKYPLGISAHFSNLQYKTVQEGFGTFPHFGAMVQYIFFGPLVLIPMYLVLRSIYCLFKRKEFQILIPVIYLTVYNILGGGPIVNPKIIYIFGTVFVLGYKKSTWDENVPTDIEYNYDSKGSIRDGN